MGSLLLPAILLVAGETGPVPTVLMQSFCPSPFGAILYALVAWFWYIFVGWLGRRWFVRRFRWPWPAVAVLQGLLAAQIYLLMVPITSLDPACSRELLPALEEFSRWCLGSVFFPLGIVASMNIDWPDWCVDLLPAIESTAVLFTLIYALQHVIGNLVERSRKRGSAVSEESPAQSG